MSLAAPARTTRNLAPASDYDTVRRILVFLAREWPRRPAMAAITEAAGADENEVQHLFRRWCGLTPKAFLQAVTIDHARAMLRDTGGLDTAPPPGLSAPGRRHDLFVTHAALAPGQWRAGGAGLTVGYGFHPSPFGEALIVTTPPDATAMSRHAHGLAGLGWVSTLEDGGKAIGGREAALADMRRRWPLACFQRDQAATAPLATRIFDPAAWSPETPLRVVLIGTDFEISLWEALLTIPVGRITTYGTLAGRIGRPEAARAVGTAVGKNPVSFVVPCHRVVGHGGALTGYHWGLTRKRAILGWEAGQVTGV